MSKKLLAVFSLLLVLMFGLAGCFSGDSEDVTKDDSTDTTDTSTDTDNSEDTEGTNDVGEEKILHLNNSSEPGALHPGLAEGTHDSWPLNHLFEGLTKKSPDGEVEPGMAEKWETSEDGLEWTFFLKQDVNWSNGDPVTAEDFKYAWLHALDPNVGSSYAYQLYYVKGATEYNSADIEAVSDEDLTKLRDGVGIEVVDEKTLKVTLAQPTPYFLDLTSFYTYFPVNKNVQEGNPEWYQEADGYVSNGAFTLEEWNHKESITLKKNENYYDKDRINLDGINFLMIEEASTTWQMYRNGELDFLYPLPQDVVGQMSENDDPEFNIAPDLAIYYYNFNTEKKPFNNAKVRKALSMAINREDLVEFVAQGGQQPAYGVVPEGINDVDGDFRQNGGALFESDIEKAKELLAEGLKEEGMDSMDEFVILYNTSEGHQAIASAIQEMWRKNLDVSTKLENVEFQVKLDREKAGDFMVSRAGWIGDYVDPMTFMDLWVTDGPYNDASWSNTDYDSLIDKAKTTMDAAERMEAMHQAEQILMDEMPVMPIYFYTKPFTVKPYVKGIYTPINKYTQFHYADIEKE
ncbi:peptide ABC transporter substrate-binding protein [Pontibacillus yanchengensis]|uniref:Peptide ABC transporter substrate-binding protein n=2 Tax=Pontibacillus yanchengensis TaxID=462910 RepID=A0ACC7VCJ3_9BACI|nr:peptide ABC transporter substrate-binding protein [Pontibacillus yanchengensis]MYL35131.1 peptide ABC transporter substrate-binding protein [Pontibacillus yanchengensis]MYL52502.1 peptide ABC transporter substrate-binding protein [Pontibacillus yanchengensis]